MITKLIIPEPHVEPNQNLKRFEKLGNLIVQLKPKYVICLGDFADMGSLNSYEKFKPHTYKEDIEANIKAQELLFRPIKRQKKKMPKFFMLEGNHEHRISRFASEYPEFANFISLGDLGYHEHGWETIHYNGKHPGILDLEGVLYAHYLTHQNTPHAISGKHHASALLDKKHKSCTVGHSHMFDYKIQTCGDGSKIQGLVAGCYFPQFKAFAGNSIAGWQRGVSIKRFYPGEPYDLQTISLNRIMKEF